MKTAFFLILIVVIFIYFTITKINTKYKLSRNELWGGLFYLFSYIIFVLQLSYFSIDYWDSVDDSFQFFYTPFANHHFLSFAFYYSTFLISSITIWLKGRNVPPLILFIYISFMIIGQLLNISIIFQTYTNVTLFENGINYGLLLQPILNIILSLKILISVSKAEVELSKNRNYQNQFLEKINTFLSKRENDPIWFIILLIPVFIICTLILVLLGQDSDSMIKVFTDTTTWHFSQKTHPPILTHEGHYLCTAAVCGTPKIVKPIRLGKRLGHIIIVNRQLQIANAFEEMIQDWSPRIHYFLRKNYDIYGYPLSLKIQKPIYSDITYLLMKPLEWGFLIALYLFCIKPEVKIRKQYSFD